MRLPIIPLIVVVIINLGVDWYIYRTICNRCQRNGKRWRQAYCIVSLLLYVLLAIGVSLPRRGDNDEILACIMWILFTYFSCYIPKLAFVIFDLIAKLPQLVNKRRIKALSGFGIFISIALFLGMWWGALINRKQIDITEVSIKIPDLPDAFNGYRIVQFSDFHVGTYGSDTAYVNKVVDEINILRPDLIVFTGDIVNRRTDELLPHVAPLSRLHAPDGVYSILGNHDYGDYSDWPNDSLKARNMEHLYEINREMGWRLLRNEHDILHRGNDSIALIGVENVGDPPFKNYGSLEKAYPDTSDSTVKILLTHNPAHWTSDIADNNDQNIALTLSGHTHAMQIELFGLSPATFRYKTWGGLYSDSTNTHQLYVNIGLGTVAIPMRFGATPELTVLTLRKADDKN